MSFRQCLRYFLAGVALSIALGTAFMHAHGFSL
jgi:hypothetical protein